ncbi:hypothetical protein AAMO2058_001563100, partial [Amorphochlora amoebiformis]
DFKSACHFIQQIVPDKEKRLLNNWMGALMDTMTNTQKDIWERPYLPATSWRNHLWEEGQSIQSCLGITNFKRSIKALFCRVFREKRAALTTALRDIVAEKKSLHRTLALRIAHYQPKKLKSAAHDYLFILEKLMGYFWKGMSEVECIKPRHAQAFFDELQASNTSLPFPMRQTVKQLKASLTNPSLSRHLDATLSSRLYGTSILRRMLTVVRLQVLSMPIEHFSNEDIRIYCEPTGQVRGGLDIMKGIRNCVVRSINAIDLNWFYRHLRYIINKWSAILQVELMEAKSQFPRAITKGCDRGLLKGLTSLFERIDVAYYKNVNCWIDNLQASVEDYKKSLTNIHIAELCPRAQFFFSTFLLTDENDTTDIIDEDAGSPRESKEEIKKDTHRSKTDPHSAYGSSDGSRNVDGYGRQNANASAPSKPTSRLDMLSNALDDTEQLLQGLQMQQHQRKIQQQMEVDRENQRQAEKDAEKDNARARPARVTGFLRSTDKNQVLGGMAGGGGAPSADAMLQLVLDPFPGPGILGRSGVVLNVFDKVRHGAAKSIKVLRFQLLEHLWIMLERLLITRLQLELGGLIRHHMEEEIDSMIEKLDLQAAISVLEANHKEAASTLRDAKLAETALEVALRKILDEPGGGDLKLTSARSLDEKIKD